jgi:CubicO group peptidase (beta-lactamase class C family)
MNIHCSTLGSDFEKVIQKAIHGLQPVDHPGVAVAVVKANEISFAGGFGFRDRAARDPVRADTRFAIGSATKAFTSMALSLYAEQKQIALDKPIQQLLAERHVDFQMQDPLASAEVNLIDILCHRSGLAPHNALWYIGPFGRSQLLYRVRYLEPFPAPAGKTAFRNVYVYNNLMYMVAGHLMEVLFGKSYGEIIQTSILDRLEMTATNLSLAGLTGGGNYAKGYEKERELPLKDFGNIGPAAEINSTVLDMAKWVQLFLRKGFGSGGGSIIPLPALQRMYTPFIATGDGTGTSYGLGWTIGTIQTEQQAKRLIFHTGDADGYSAYVSFMPDDGLGVVVLTNQHCMPKMINHWPDKVAAAIYDYLLHGEVTGKLRLSGRAVPADPSYPDGFGSPPAGFVLPSPGGYTGMFSNPGYGDFVVGCSGDDLTISYYGQTWPLRPFPGDTQFLFQIVAFGANFPVFVKFGRSRTGAIESFEASLVGQPVLLFIPFVKR